MGSEMCIRDRTRGCSLWSFLLCNGSWGCSPGSRVEFFGPGAAPPSTAKYVNEAGAATPEAVTNGSRPGAAAQTVFARQARAFRALWLAPPRCRRSAGFACTPGGTTWRGRPGSTTRTRLRDETRLRRRQDCSGRRRSCRCRRAAAGRGGRAFLRRTPETRPCSRTRRAACRAGSRPFPFRTGTD